MGPPKQPVKGDVYMICETQLQWNLFNQYPILPFEPSSLNDHQS
jgi:hypothetical protein